MARGSAGVHTTESAPAATSIDVIPSPIANPRWTRPRQRLVIPDSRIEPRVREVDGEVDGHDARGHEQRDALDDRQVAGGDGAEGEPAEARQREDGFQDDAARQELAELQAGHGDDGDQGVAERVLED